MNTNMIPIAHFFLCLAASLSGCATPYVIEQSKADPIDVRYFWVEKVEPPKIVVGWDRDKPESKEDMPVLRTEHLFSFSLGDTDCESTTVSVNGKELPNWGRGGARRIEAINSPTPAMPDAGDPACQVSLSFGTFKSPAMSGIVAATPSGLLATEPASEGNKAWLIGLPVALVGDATAILIALGAAGGAGGM